MITYELNGSGYLVFDEHGKPWVNVPGDPDGVAENGVLPPFLSAEHATAHAIRTVAEIAGTPPPTLG